MHTETTRSIQLSDGAFTDDFFPFSETRSVADLRCGILTIREKWARHFTVVGTSEEAVSIPSNCFPEEDLIHAIRSGKEQALKAVLETTPKLLHTIDLIRQNDKAIRKDFADITRDRCSLPVSLTNQIIASKTPAGMQATSPSIFIEAGAVVEHCLLNVSDGPIYIGKDAVIMEGCSIRGPFALGEKAVLKMGSRVYGATTIGPHSVAGGEIKNSIIFGYSNKAHEGYLGDSIIGEWCNLGAGTSNSNIKNSGGPVKYWNPIKKEWTGAGQKGGLFMGDYSRSAINTSFNTGTVVGTCAHVFGKGLTPAYLSSFSWGFDPEETYDFDKAIRHIRQWMQLKNETLSENEIKKLKFIFDQKNNLS